MTKQGNSYLKEPNTRLLPEPELSLKRVTSDRHKEAGDDLWERSYILSLALYSFKCANTSPKIFPALIRCRFSKKKKLMLKSENQVKVITVKEILYEKLFQKFLVWLY